MKVVFFAALLAAFHIAGLSQTAAHSGAIYRCGNDFLNDAAQAQARGCSLVEASAVTVTVPGTRVQSRAAESEQVQASTPATSMQSPTKARTASAPPPKSLISASDDQRARDRDALSILQAELGKAEALLAERQRERADPRRQGPRLGELQSSISRQLSDIAGLKREISRLPGQSPVQSTVHPKFQSALQSK